MKLLLSLFFLFFCKSFYKFKIQTQPKQTQPPRTPTRHLQNPPRLESASERLVLATGKRCSFWHPNRSHLHSFFSGQSGHLHQILNPKLPPCINPPSPLDSLALAFFFCFAKFKYNFGWRGDQAWQNLWTNFCFVSMKTTETLCFHGAFNRSIGRILKFYRFHQITPKPFNHL